MERRELFSSLTSSFQKKEQVESILRPPYYVNESAFHKECINCDGKCSNFCEEHIIKIGEDKTPYLDFSNSGCTYCDECALACNEYNVLNIEDKKQINANISIDISKCLSWNQTMCFSCKDPCLDDAIEFIGMFRPEIISDKCTSCGFCIKTCPTNAIEIKVIR
ncbi:MAG: ferredoxin [Arcobacter sp.]|nr:MAG: ferredoxin [Arcobacter sp.]